jgi:multiple sugar transport system permease protein
MVKAHEMGSADLNPTTANRPPEARDGRHRVNRRSVRSGYRWIISLYLICLYFPVYWMFTMAFKQRVDITVRPPKLFFQPVLDNFAYLFSRGSVQAPMLLSLWVATIAVLLSLILGAMCAFALARFQWFRQKDIEFFIASTRMLPPVAVIIPYYSVFIQFHLLDNSFALAIVYLLIDLPLVIWLLLGFFRTIPKELDDAARIDGCGAIKTFLYVDLPLVKSGLLTAAVLSFLFTWGELFFAFILTSVNRTFPVALLSFLAVGLEVQYGPMAAAGVIAIIPSILLAVFARRALIEGFRNLAGIH